MKVSIEEMKMISGYFRTRNFRGDVSLELMYEYIKNGAYIDSYTLFKLWKDKGVEISQTQFYNVIEDWIEPYGDYFLNKPEVEIDPTYKYTYKIYDIIVNSKKALLEKIDEMVDEYNPTIEISSFRRISDTCKDYYYEEEHEMYNPETGEITEYADKDTCYAAKDSLLNELKENRRNEIIRNTKQLVVDKNDTKLKIWIKYNA